MGLTPTTLPERSSATTCTRASHSSRFTLKGFATPPPALDLGAGSVLSQVLQPRVEHHGGTIGIGIGGEASRAQHHQGIGSALLGEGRAFLPGHLGDRLGHPFQGSSHGGSLCGGELGFQTELALLEPPPDLPGLLDHADLFGALARARRSASSRILTVAWDSAQRSGRPLQPGWRTGRAPRPCPVPGVLIQGPPTAVGALPAHRPHGSAVRPSNRRCPCASRASGHRRGLPTTPSHGRWASSRSDARARADTSR
jgi:hypothetical protein